MHQGYKGSWHTLIFAAVFLVAFALNCVIVSGLDIALRYPHSSEEAVWDEIGEYSPLAKAGHYTTYGITANLVETENGTELVAVEKHFLFDRYRLLSRETVEEGNNLVIKGSRSRIRITVQEHSLQLNSASDLGTRILPFSQVKLPLTLLLLCVALVILEIILTVVISRIRGN